MTREDFTERKAQRRIRIKQRRAERIEKAELALREETRADIVQRAKHTLIQEELAERIDTAEESLDQMKKS